MRPPISLADAITAFAVLQPEDDEAGRGILNALGLRTNEPETKNEPNDQNRKAKPKGSVKAAGTRSRKRRQ